MRMKQYFYSRLRSFKFAFSGLWYGLRTQQNIRIHLLATIIVILLGLWLRLNTSDWALLVVTIGAVWALEFVNTAIESTIDLVSPQNHPLAKAAKDTGATSVLMAAIVSVVIGVLIIGPPLYQKIILILNIGQ